MLSRRLIYTVLVSAIILVVAFVVFFAFNSLEEQSFSTNSNKTNTATTEFLHRPIATENSVQKISSTIEPISFEDLVMECPSPFEQFESEPCASMIESYFMNQSYVPPGGFPWLEPQNRMSYNRIFEDPHHDRDLVFKALARPECQFKANDSIRPDLRESCHAESFTALASFLGVCQLNWVSNNFYNNELDSSFEWNLEEKDHLSQVEVWNKRLKVALTKDDGTMSLRQYSRLKEEIWKNAFQRNWIVRKCGEYKTRPIVFEPLGKDREQYNLILTIGNSLGMSPVRQREDERYATLDSFNLIYAIAAHLGDTTASLRFANERVFASHKVDSSLVAYAHKKHPWMKYFYDAGQLWEFGRYQSDESSDSLPFTTFMKRTIKGLLALDEADLDYDIEMLVDQICRGVPYWHKQRTGLEVSCQTTIELLNASTDLGFQEALILDRFERTAVELGVYEP